MPVRTLMHSQLLMNTVSPEQGTGPPYFYPPHKPQCALDAPSLAPVNDFNVTCFAYQDASSSVYHTRAYELLKLLGRGGGISVQRSRITATACSASEHLENKAATHFKYTPNAALQHILLFVILIWIKMYFYMSSEFSTLNYNNQDQKDTL